MVSHRGRVDVVSLRGRVEMASLRCRVDVVSLRSRVEVVSLKQGFSLFPPTWCIPIDIQDSCQDTPFINKICTFG